MKLGLAPAFSAKIPGSPAGRASTHTYNPSFSTKRLILRLPAIADFPACRDVVASPRAAFMGGPHDTAKAWDRFCNDVAQSALQRLGGLTMALSGKPFGQVAVCCGPNCPEPELGWFLFDAAHEGDVAHEGDAAHDGDVAHEGKGFAFKAASTLRDRAPGQRGLDTIVSDIDPANLASIRLATRLGGTLDANAATPGGAPCLTYRYSAPQEIS